MAFHHRLRHHLHNHFIPHEGNGYHPHALRTPWVHTYGAILIGVKVLSVALVSLYAGVAHQTSITSSQIIALSNQARKEQGMTLVKSNGALARAAQAKAQDMIAKNYFAHISPSNVSPWYWYKQAGYKYAYAGENLAIDYVNASDVVAAWLKSPSHRRNLLNTRFQDIGVAVATGKINGAESVIVVQMFGAPVATKSVTKPKTVTQTPDPKKTAATIAAAPKPQVLGQEADKAPLATPTISSPQQNSLVRTATPTIVGQAEAGSQVQLLVAGKAVGSTTTSSQGVFSLLPNTNLPEGSVTVSVVASARGQTATSAVSTISVDLQAPTLIEGGSIVLPSLAEPGVFDLRVQASADALSVAVLRGATTVPLDRQGNYFVGRFSREVGGGAPGSIRVIITDQARNTSTAPLLNPDVFTTGVVANKGPAASAIHAIFFSRLFFVVFLVLVMIGMGVNMAMTWRRQHHPALFASLLLVYITGALFFL